MGGRPLEAMALIGIGLRRLSITPAGVGPVKAMIRSLDASAIAPVIQELVARGAQDMRAQLTAWGNDQAVDLAV